MQVYISSRFTATGSKPTTGLGPSSVYTTNEVNPAQVGRFTPSGNIPNSVPKPWFPTSIPSAHPFIHRGRENPRRNPTPCSVLHPAGAYSPMTPSTATPRRPSSTVPDEDPSSISSSLRFSHPVLHLQGAAPTVPSSFAPPPFPHRRLYLHHRKSIIITVSSDEVAA